jgi:hypothetical protein
VFSRRAVQYLCFRLVTRIALLASPCVKTFNSLFPFRVFREELKSHGLQFEIQNRINYPYLSQFDEVWIFDDDYRSLLPAKQRDRDGALKMLGRLRQTGGTLRWIDNSDSSGRLRSYVFRFADSYIKSQSLAAPKAYLENTVTGVGFRDYFALKYKVTDKSTTPKEPLKEEDLAKIEVGWNLGLSDWGARLNHGRCNEWLTRLLGRPYYPIDRRLAYVCHKLTSAHYDLHSSSVPLSKRRIHVHCRAVECDSPSVNAHRQGVREILSDMGRRRSLVMATEGWVGRTRYFAEMAG